jgi:hypothetical protein
VAGHPTVPIYHPESGVIILPYGYGPVRITTQYRLLIRKSYYNDITLRLLGILPYYLPSGLVRSRASGFYPIYRKRPVRFRIPVYTRLSVSLRLPALLQYVSPSLRAPSGTGNRQHSTLDTSPVSPGALLTFLLFNTPPEHY